MFLSNNSQVREQVSDLRSAFRPTNMQQNYTGLQEKLIHFNSKPILPIFSNQLFPVIAQKQRLHDTEVWSRAQIERLFKLYDYYGPQWKIMSQHMSLRTANNLKNRFYTVLRNLIKLLFRKKGENCPKLPGEIPSKDLSRLYDGKQDYKQFKNLVSNILCELNFNLDNENIDFVVKNYSDQIVKVYQTIYGERALAVQQSPDQKIEKTDCKSQEKPTISTNSDLFPAKQLGNGSPTIQCPEPLRTQNNPKTAPNDQLGYVYVFFYNPVDFFSGQTRF